jgi:hypothetical protein
VPVIVTTVPTAPKTGEIALIVGGNNTVKLSLLLANPPVVTMTLPEEAAVGTGVSIWVSLQLVGVANVPLNVTVLVPWASPKFAPAIVTIVPTGPELGVSEPTEDGVRTVKLTPPLNRLSDVKPSFPSTTIRIPDECS